MSQSPDPYAALKIPDYRRFLAMRLTTTLTVQIMAVSVGYYVYELTNDPLMLGFIGLAEALPAIGISLWAGHLADKYNRRNLLVGCISVLLVCSLALTAVALGQAQLKTTTLLACIYGIMFFTGIARGFFSPTNFAFLPQIVDRDRLQNAISWNSSTWEVASITGLGIGGLIYGYWGVAAAFGTMTGLCALALIFVLLISSRPVPAFDRTETALTRIRAGLSFVFSKQLIIATIAMDLFAVFFGGAVALIPVFAKDILQVGPQGAGLLRAAMAVGAISMAIFIAHKPLGKGAGKIMLICVAGFGLCNIGFGLSTNFYLSFGVLVLAGMFDEVSVFIRSALVHFQTPENMKGRVSSVSTIFITSSNELGAFESGVAARLMGTVPSVVFGGLMTLGVVAFTWWKAPKLRDYDFKGAKGSAADFEEGEVLDGHLTKEKTLPE
ncbi:MAG: MFS transporter [Phycisphaerae bacterium]|nr:MFS transporter [Saprospiraceae bacterium]